MSQPGTPPPPRHPGAAEDTPVIAATRAIADDEAPAPSTLCREPGLRRQLRGDVDAIVLKALRKQPEQRYRSAASMADDFRRVLNGESVSARRGNRWYRLRMALYRHRLGAISTAAVLILAMTVLGLRLHQVGTERDNATAMSGFLGGLITDIYPASRNHNDATRITVLEVLDAGRTRLRQSTLLPAIRATLLVKLARGYNSVRASRKAEAAARDALRYGSSGGLADAAGFEARMALAVALAAQGRYSAAEIEFDVLRRQASGKSLLAARVARLHGGAKIAAGRPREGRKLLLQARANLDPGKDTENLIRTLHELSRAENQLGNGAAAREAARQALELNRTRLPEQRLLLADSEELYATTLRTRDPAAAEPLMRRALVSLRELLGPDHREVLAAQNNYALLLGQLGRNTEAEKLFRHRLTELARDPIHNERSIAETWQNLATALCDERKQAACIDAAARAQAGFAKSLPEHHYLRAYPLLTMAGAQLASDQPQAARESLLQAHALLEPALPETAPSRQVLSARLAMSDAAQGRCRQSLPQLTQIFARLGTVYRVRFGKEFSRAYQQCRQPIPDMMRHFLKPSSADSLPPA